MSRILAARWAGLFFLGACALIRTVNGAPAAQAPIYPADAQAVRELLTEKGLAAQWEGDPFALSSDELNQAYPNVRFFFTFQPRPLPPGAPMPELLAAYKEKMQEYRKHSLRLTVGINEKGFAATYQTPRDFNVGLRSVTSAETAKVAAAAILSLMDADQIGPRAIGAEEVTVERTKTGWSCQVAQAKGIKGTVTFDNSGQCTSATKRLNFVPPMPP